MYFVMNPVIVQRHETLFVWYVRFINKVIIIIIIIIQSTESDWI